MNDDLKIPQNFVRTAPYYNRNNRGYRNSIAAAHAVINPQTVTLCERLGIRDPITDLIEDRGRKSYGFSSPIGFSTPERLQYSNDTTYMSFNSSSASDRNDSFNSRTSSICINTSVPEFSSPDQSLKKVKLSLPPVEHSLIACTDSDSNILSTQKEDESVDVETLSFNVDRNGE